MTAKNSWATIALLLSCAAPAPASLPDLPGDAADLNAPEARDASCDLARDLAIPTDSGVPPPELASCALSSSLAGRYYRFDRLQVREPAGPEGALAATLTQLWTTEIHDDELNIVLHVVRDDRATGELDIEAGTAYRTPEGRYRLSNDPPARSLKLLLDGCRFRGRELGVLDVFPDLLKIPVAVLDTFTQGRFSADAGRIEAGWLAGGICRSMAADQFFKLTKQMEGCINLLQFMSDLGVDPDRHDLPCGGCDGHAIHDRAAAAQSSALPDYRTGDPRGHGDLTPGEPMDLAVRQQATRILIVDDDEKVRRLLARILTREGFTCDLAADAAQALEDIEDREYDLVITDVNMPGMSGMELLAEVLVRRPDTSVILVTGLNNTSTAVTALEHGAYDYILKP